MSSCDRWSNNAYLAARYGLNQPDAVVKRKEIESLRALVWGNASSEELVLKLKNAQAEIGLIQKRYFPDHPDIKRLINGCRSETDRQ